MTDSMSPNPRVRTRAPVRKRTPGRPAGKRGDAGAAGLRQQLLDAAIACFVVGLGLGLVASPTLIAAQSSVPWAERGVVTGANMFLRSVGSAVGVAIFGAVANGVIARSGQGDHSPGAIQQAATAVFVAVAVAAVATIAAAVAMPRARVEDVELAPEASGAVVE